MSRHHDDHATALLRDEASWLLLRARGHRMLSRRARSEVERAALLDVVVATQHRLASLRRALLLLGRDAATRRALRRSALAPLVASGPPR